MKLNKQVALGTIVKIVGAVIIVVFGIGMVYPRVLQIDSVQAVVAAHTTSIAVLEAGIGDVRGDIDEIKTGINSLDAKFDKYLFQKQK